MPINAFRLNDQYLRVTYYGRVSTETDEQLGSLEHQRQYFEDKIKSNPNWTYVEGYIDEGITGTNTDERDEFKRMISDAKRGNFDLIVTKEVSRFARDIVDAIQTSRDLLAVGVAILFEDIQLNTMEPGAEFTLGIMAIVAQEESSKISRRTKFGYAQSAKNGTRHGPTAPIGYVFNDENNGYSIDKEKAEIVRYVFNTYSKGEYGFHSIAKQLASMGYLNSNNVPFSDVVLKRMINNPTYMGYIVNKKTSKESYRSKKIKHNPIEDWLLHYCPDRVPPLVSKEVWEKANSVAERKRKQFAGMNTSNVDPSGAGKFAYSGRITCGCCGTAFSHIVAKWKAANGEQKCNDGWRCGKYIRHGKNACDAPTIYTEDLNNIMKSLFADYRDKLLKDGMSLAKIIEKAIAENNEEKERIKLLGQKEKLEAKNDKLLEGWLSGVVQTQDYKTKTEEITSKIADIDNQLSLLDESVDNNKRRIRAASVVDEMFKTATLDNDNIIEGLVRVLVRKIVVHHDSIEVYLTNIDSPNTIMLENSGENSVSKIQHKRAFML
jgi:site-specific DNA recombinase